MKKILLGFSCLLLLGCETEKVCPRADCFVSETSEKMTEDMQKIMKIIVDFRKEALCSESEQRLKRLKAIVELYGKNNEKLYQELEKMDDFTSERMSHAHLRQTAIKTSLNGLRLNYNDVLPLAMEIEKSYAILDAEEKKIYEPYREQARKIIKSLQAEEDRSPEYTFGRDSRYKSMIRSDASIAVEETYDKFSSYNNIIFQLLSYISRGILVDSFLEKNKTFLNPEEESIFAWVTSAVHFVPVNEKWFTTLDSVKKAAAQKLIDRKELQRIIADVAHYLSRLAFAAVDIQRDVTDGIDHDSSEDMYREIRRNNFFSYGRYVIVDLAKKYPNSHDFEREIDALSTRLAYSTYHRVNIARFLYKKWLDNHRPRMAEFFKDSKRLADSLYAVCKDEKVSADDSYKRQDERRNNLQNIAIIDEIVKIGAERIFSVPCCYVDSIPVIKKSYRTRFMKIRSAYLKHVELEKPTRH
ncbi:MAG: hypothetical protein LBD81_02105 [Holosporaceae bacterium]|jgi:hypothetical protein|nr:hypothetical protein [Holosporaceae bacterium]